jgi:hypothetical protein
MKNDNGFNLSDLVPQGMNPASESPIKGQLSPAIVGENPAPEIDVLTIDNPKALINLIPKGYREIILETVHHGDMQEFYAMYLLGDSQKLDKKVNPSKIDHALRYNLWTQYYQALETGAPNLSMNRVCAGVTTLTTFDHIIRSRRLFWLLLPPTDYTVANRRAFERSLDRLHQILDLDPVNEVTGKVNTSLINLQIKIHAILDARLNGPIAQRHEITTKNVHLGITADQVKKLYEETQRDVAKLTERDTVLRNSDIIEIQTHVKEYEK